MNHGSWRISRLRLWTIVGRWPSVVVKHLVEFKFPAVTLCCKRFSSADDSFSLCEKLRIFRVENPAKEETETVRDQSCWILNPTIGRFVEMEMEVAVYNFNAEPQSELGRVWKSWDWFSRYWKFDGSFFLLYVVLELLYFVLKLLDVVLEFWPWRGTSVEPFGLGSSQRSRARNIICHCLITWFWVLALVNWEKSTTGLIDKIRLNENASIIIFSFLLI